MKHQSTEPLHPVHGRNSYCGPAAISTITGASTDLAAKLIRRKTGAQSVKGAYFSDLAYAFDCLGFKASDGCGWQIGGKYPTLSKWLSDHRNPAFTYLVQVTGHWLVVRCDMLADSRHRTPTDIGSADGMRCRVQRTWKMIETPETYRFDLMRAIEVEESDRRAGASKMAAARRMAKKHGFEITSCREEFGGDSTGYMVYPGDLYEECEHVDPYEGDHFADDALEVWHRSRVYAEAAVG